MAWVPIIPIINNGNGWGRSYTPPDEKPCYMFYQRKHENTTYRFKWYVEKLKDAKPTMMREGFEFVAYAVEQDGYTERLVYNPKTNRCTMTGELM
jgi:hypothetical protein